MVRYLVVAALALAGCGGSVAPCYNFGEIRCSADRGTVEQCSESATWELATTCPPGLSCAPVAVAAPELGLVFTDLRCVAP
jgi:hypothetical protein